MTFKRFFSKQLNILLFVSVMFLLVGLLFGIVIPNTLFNLQINAIEEELSELAFNHKNITEVSSTQILYVYRNGDSSMLTSTGYILDIDEEVEHHLIHWSEDQFVEALLYRDDFQNKNFIYYIYVVEQDYYVVAFADTSEVLMFVDNFRSSSLVSISILFVLSLIFTSTVFNSSLTKQYSLFDPITNLNTKASLYNRFNNKDLTNYKITYHRIYNLQDIIDACGLKYNDDILRMIASNINKHSNPDTVYQISSNEFIIVTPKDNPYTLDFQHAINHWDSSIMPVATYEFKVKTIGIDTDTLQDVKINTLMKRFHFAYSKIANTKQDNYHVEQALVDEMVQEQFYQINLGKAIQDGKIINYYQPKVDPNTNQVIGAESLSRWEGENGIISPGKYIHLAEANGMIYDIDLISFQNSLRFIKELEDNDLIHQEFKLSSNFSPITLKNVTFEQLQKLIESIQVHPKHISIEITESAVLEFDVIKELLSKLSEYGVTIEIDDFSAGNSSFTVLRMLHANIVKLDRAILPETEEDEREKLIYNSLVDISKKLGLKIISEGVENDSQQTFVRNLGVEAIQGYFYSRPLNKVNFIDYLKNHK